MATKAIENSASSALVFAGMIDFGLLIYYLTLSSDNIDAMWNLPFIAAWLAAPIALFSLNAYLYKIKPRSKPMVIASTIIVLVPVSLVVLTRLHIFIR